MTKRNRTTSGSNFGLFGGPKGWGVSGQYNPGGTSSHGKKALRGGTGGKVGKYKGPSGTYTDSKGVERYHATGNATKEWRANKKRNEFLANMEIEMGKTPEVPLATIDRAPDLFSSLDINQMNKDRKYVGIGKNVKKVSDFMTPEKWDALSPEEKNRMNESYTSKNTTYYGTGADDPENLYGNMSEEERDRKLKELQAGAD